jgi:hypothetical protein
MISFDGCFSNGLQSGGPGKTGFWSFAGFRFGWDRHKVEFGGTPKPPGKKPRLAVCGPGL